MLAKFISQLMMIALATTAKAQTEDVTQLEVIEIRGTKENKNFFENTESISVLKEKDVPTAGKENGLNVLNAVPNVEVNKNGESFSIRGINNTGVTGYQKDNLSSIVVDGLFQTDLAIQAGSFTLWDMDRIEILRGAQSTSQGVNSLAGSILLDHQRPQFSDEGSFKLGTGTYGYRELGVATNHQLIGDKLSTRLTYEKEGSDGYIKNVTTGNKKWGESNKDRASLGFLYQISESQKVNLNLKFNRQMQGGAYTQTANPFDYEVSEDQDSKTTTENSQIILGHQKIYSDKISQNITLGLSQSQQSVVSDADGTAQNTAGVRRENHKDKYTSLEARWNYDTNKVRNLFGLHAHQFSLVDDYDFNLLYPVGSSISTPIDIKQEVERSRSVQSIFNSFTYSFTQSHSMNFGIRGEYSHSKYSTNVNGTRLQNLGVSNNATLDNYLSQISGAYQGKKNSTVFLPKIGYAFKHQGHYAGLTYTKGYRTAGLSINRRQAQAVEYNPEFTDNYEASYKYAGKNWQWSSNVFYINWSEQQVQVQLSNDFFDSQVVNAARSELYGAETEGKFNINTEHTVNLGAGYVDTKFKEFEVRNQNYTGKKFPYAANWTTRLGHEFKPSDKWSFLSTLRYLSGAYSNAENTLKVDSQLYLNLGAKYAIQNWVIEAYVNNALDGEFHIFDGSPTSTTSPYQASYHQTSAPREIGLRGRYFW